MQDRSDLIERINALQADRPPVLSKSRIIEYVEPFVNNRDDFLYLRQSSGSPLYIIDKDTLTKRAGQFMSALEKHFPGAAAFYAMKSNNNRTIIRALVEQGFGVDVSSGEELQLALECKAQKIVFNGPGKTERELDLAVANRDRVTIIVDNFSELRRLHESTVTQNCAVKIGVRLNVDESGLWKKFGIPLDRLPAFIEAVKSYDKITLSGIHFHTSWNLFPDRVSAFISRLGKALSALPGDVRKGFDFLDIGGGFWPGRGEWQLSTATRDGQLFKILNNEMIPTEEPKFLVSASIGEYFTTVQAAWKMHLAPHIDARVYVEPGRWLSDDSMLILLRVMDKKADDLVITDGGTNIVGWERYEADYCPVINLTRPALRENKCQIQGSLCTPHDVWGFSYWGAGIEENDTLLIPSQGAYTFCLRQTFIKPLPRCVVYSRRTKTQASKNQVKV
ncbi:MAG: alanine racemase [Candidatus Zixiibacteriota bacterium]